MSWPDRPIEELDRIIGTFEGAIPETRPRREWRTDEQEYPYRCVIAVPAVPWWMLDYHTRERTFDFDDEMLFNFGLFRTGMRGQRIGFFPAFPLSEDMPARIWECK